MKNKVQYMLLFTLTYFTGYLARSNFPTIISEIVSGTGYTKSGVSVCLTGSFFAYALGQLVSGYLGDRVSPKRLVQSGLLTSVTMNTLLPFSRSVPLMVVLWSINGFAQAFLWPPIVKMMTALFNADEYNKASVMVSFGSTLGPIVLYLVCPLIISLSGWKTVFHTSAIFGAIMLAAFSILCPDIKNGKKLDTNKPIDTENPSSAPSGRIPFIFLLVFLAIIVQGALKDGVTTWTPSYIDETFKIGNKLAILVSVILPVFSTLSFTAAAWIYAKLLKNPMTCAGFFYICGLVGAILLKFTRGQNAITDVLFIALLVGSMHGVNMILISMLPTYFKNSGYVSFISGFLNCCSYVGSAISTYGIALYSEKAGWNSTVTLWCAMTLVGAVLCLSCTPYWKKKYGK